MTSFPRCPSRTSPAFRLTCFLLLAGLFPLRAEAAIRYSISLAGRAENRFRVRMEIPNANNETELDMPVWNGLYQVREFASRIVALHAATLEGVAIPLRRITPHSWLAGHVGGTLVVQYSIDWDEPGPFSSQLNEAHAFLNPATVLLYVPSRRLADVSLEFRDLPAGWRMAAALDSGGAPNSFIAASYDDLAQAPIELGTFTDFSLQAAGRPIRVVVHAAPPTGESAALWSRKHLEDAARRIVESQTRLMGDAPFPRYLFILHLGTGGGGGMEHPNSTAIAAGQGEDPAPTMAHELFHAWNVLRIRPQSLEPVDYAREQPTDALWFAEGVTSTIASYTMVRTGLWTREQFYADLAGQIAELESRPARLDESAEDSSIATWLDRFPYYARPESSISYYNKGQLLGVCLDITLREATGNSQSLDSLLRAMNQRFAQQHKFYDDSAAIQALAGELARRDFSDFFRSYVAGTEEIPFAQILAKGGFNLQQAGAAPGDAGFSAARANAAGAVVTSVEPQGPAERAGLRRGDIIVEWNGAPAPPRLGPFLARLAPGDEIRLRILRGAETRLISFRAARGSSRAYRITDSGAEGLPRAIREGILTGAPHP
jgi:predicted metalloprotease with PDZ domain